MRVRDQLDCPAALKPRETKPHREFRLAAGFQAILRVPRRSAPTGAKPVSRSVPTVSSHDCRRDAFRGLSTTAAERASVHVTSRNSSSIFQLSRVWKLAWPASPLQATNASRASPRYMGSKSVGPSSPGGTTSNARPLAWNQDRPGREAFADKLAKRRTYQRQRQRPVNHLEPIEKPLELLICPLKFEPALGIGPPASRLKR